MNKLQGFYHLQRLGIPTVAWKLYTEDTILDPSLLWTIRVAVEHGEDTNLPRAVGVDSQTATNRAQDLLTQLQNNGIVIYYPYFIALKSGTLEVSNNKVIIEAVREDLWNLVTTGNKEVTVIIDWRTKSRSSHGDANFLEEEEMEQLLRHSARVRAKLKDYISHDSSVLLEWSYAKNSNISRQPIGKKYLVFYECRTIEHNSFSSS